MKTASANKTRAFRFLAISAVMGMVLACNFPLLRTADPAAAPQEPASPAVPGLPGATSGNDTALEACLPAVVPGSTTRAQVTAALGEPVQSRQEGEFENLYYPSAVPKMFDVVTLKDQVVVRVVAHHGEKHPLGWSEVLARHGEPAHQAYSDFSQGSRTYSFPEKGLAYIANPELDVVLARWCFPPMGLDAFLAEYGSVLLEEDPFDR